MLTRFTARRFRARQELKEFATDAVKKLDKFYDGILRADVILSFEGATKNIKIAEINLHVFGTMLTAREKSEDYHKSVELAVEKMNGQLAKYKSKLRAKDKNKVRSMQDKV
ncbi:MAG TPA: ribosome-associated translation inhibitor RaiA [Bacteroidota bacterium]|nr:ribosome-associated translation inhibitor RaiA [Bacteroidota bacterium]